MDSVVLNFKHSRVKTSKYAYGATKEDKWKVRIKGSVERQVPIPYRARAKTRFLFTVRHSTMYVLPVVINGHEFRMVNHEDLLAMGFPGCVGLGEEGGNHLA